jgi:hypothetical protein
MQERFVEVLGDTDVVSVDSPGSHWLAPALGASRIIRPNRSPVSGASRCEGSEITPCRDGLREAPDRPSPLGNRQPTERFVDSRRDQEDPGKPTTD